MTGIVYHFVCIPSACLFFAAALFDNAVRNVIALAGVLEIGIALLFASQYAHASWVAQWMIDSIKSWSFAAALPESIPAHKALGVFLLILCCVVILETAQDISSQVSMFGFSVPPSVLFPFLFVWEIFVVLVLSMGARFGRR